MVSRILNTSERSHMILRKGFVLLWIVTCLGCPQQPATQEELAITQSESTHAKDTPVRAEPELTPTKTAPITPEIPPVPPQNARVRELQEERLRVCQELVNYNQVEQDHGGNILFADLLKGRQNLLEAQLELAETKADRIRIYQELVQGMESLHKVVETQSREGMLRRTDVMWSTSNLLKAQIALEKEKSSPE